MTKIVLFFFDSGPSENITNIIKKFKNKIDWHFFAYTTSPAYKHIKNKSLDKFFIDMQQIKNIKEKIKSIQPDFIFVGTSWQNKTHLDFIRYSKELFIPSVAMMEHWINYRERFDYPNKDWEKNKPDFITVNDDHAYSIAKKLGFNNIIKLKFYTLINDIKKLKTHNIIEKNEVLFISEPTKNVALSHYNDENYWGFNEFNIIENIADNLEHFQTKNLKIRLHPSDEKGKYDYLFKKYKNLSITIEDPYKIALLDSVLSSKIIIGIDGFVLYFAKILGKYSISYIPNNKRICVVPIFKQNHITKIDKNNSLEQFKRKKSIKETKQFGITFMKMLSIINSSKKLKATIIGCGNIGGLYDNPKSKNIFTHAHAYKKNENTILTSCCDLNSTNIFQFKKLWGDQINDYNCADTLLKEEKPNIVSLATATYSHYSILKTLLKDPNVQHIICEKPFVSTLKEFNEIEKIIKNSNKNIIINFIRCFDPSINKVKKLIHSNKLGKVISFNSQFNKGIYHNGSHTLSLIEHLIGNISSIKVANKQTIDNDIYGNFTLTINEGIFGAIDNFYQTDFSTLELTIILEQGVIKILNSGFDIIVYRSEESNFKGVKQLKLYKRYPSSFKYYAKHSLEFLLNNNTKEQLENHLNISKKLLILKEKFLIQNNNEVIF